MMLLAPIPWAQCVWALPFLTVLAPSERYYRERQLRHKLLTDWARQMLIQVRTWLPNRQLVVVADSTYAALELLAAAQAPYVQVRLDSPRYAAAFAQAGFQVTNQSWGTFMVKPLASDATSGHFRQSYGVDSGRFLVSYMDVT